MSPMMRKMMLVSLGEAVMAVEKMIEAAIDRDVRNILVARLATLDQRSAALRDGRDAPELPFCEGRR